MQVQRIEYKDGINASQHRQGPAKFYKQITVIDLDRGVEVVTCRLYNQSLLENTSCCLWTNCPKGSSRGFASADNVVDAIQDALISAGVNVLVRTDNIYKCHDLLMVVACNDGANRVMITEAHS